MKEAAGTRNLSDKLIGLLREKVRENSKQELLAYIDEVVPEYELSQPEATHIDDRTEYRLEEFLQFYDEDFIQFLYAAIFKREPDHVGLTTGLEVLQVEKLSRIHLLGRLRYSGEGGRHGVIIRGLKPLYFLVRLQKVPFLGGFISAFTNLKLLDSLDTKTTASQLAMAETESLLGETTQSLAAHFSSVEENLHASVADGTSFEIESGNLSHSQQGPVPPVALLEVLKLAGSDFVRVAYRIICSREPTDKELADSVQRFYEGTTTRIQLMGKLCASAGVRPDDTGIIGLAGACRREKIESIPVLGFLYRLPRLLFMLSRLDAILDYQDAQVASGARRITAAEARLVGHYNSTVRQLKREALDAMQSAGDSEPRD